jgi:hypothetical protein
MWCAHTRGEHATAAQDRDHVLDEQLQPGREYVGHQVKAVDRTGQEPLLDGIGDLFGRADHQPVPGDDAVKDLADGEILPTREIHDDVPGALRAPDGIGAVEQPLRQRFIPFEFGRVDAELSRQVRQPAVPCEFVEFAVAAVSLLLGAAQHEGQPGSEANRRAMLYGSSNDVDTVPMSPRCVVTDASVESSTSGSSASGGATRG